MQTKKRRSVKTMLQGYTGYVLFRQDLDYIERDYNEVEAYISVWSSKLSC